MRMYDNIPGAKNPNYQQELFLQKAADLARRSSMNHRHGCIIVKDGEIISEGFNSTEVQLYHVNSIHAEIDCLSKLKKNPKMLQDCEMYVVRIGTEKMGNPLKYSKPCQDCTKVILKSGIKKIYYSTSEEFYIKYEKILFNEQKNSKAARRNNRINNNIYG